MNMDLHTYIETEILPRYEAFDAAHRTDHVRMVIARSLELATHYEVDAEMVYTVAAMKCSTPSSAILFITSPHGFTVQLRSS